MEEREFNRTGLKNSVKMRAIVPVPEMRIDRVHDGC
jgi:hypothetical protein